MSLTIIQKPLYKLLPANAPIIYTVADNTSVTTKFKVKFIADIYVHEQLAATLSASNMVNTVKVTPNSNGVGIMDLRTVLSSHVDAQRTGSDTGALSEFKGSKDPHSIHLIDRNARDNESVRYYTVKFRVEYAEAPSGVVSDSGQVVADSARILYNGYLKSTDVIRQDGLDYGFDLESRKLIINSDTSCMLSNMPTELYAREDDYGTFSYFGMLDSTNSDFTVGTNGSDNTIHGWKFDMYSDDVGLGSFTMSVNYTNGYQTSFSTNSNVIKGFTGVYPANLRTHSSFSSVLSQMSYYTVKALDSNNNFISKEYKINIIKDDCKGYEGIRLAWLNQYGAYDYYTFNKKSIRSTNVKRQTYVQHSGTWNGASYIMNAGLGGTRSYNVSSKESISMTTDYISEADGNMFEEMILSPEVLLINKYDAIDANGLVNKYVEPVMLTNNSLTRKTQANDKLISYEFTIEKSKSTNTQII